MNRGLFYTLAALCAAGFVYTLHGTFYATPIDKTLLFNQKIFYYHVPNWFMLFAAVIACGIYSVLYLRRHEPRYDDVALALGEIAVFFGALGMVTGSIWGKAAWSTWWTWDARLTTSLLLWMTMIGYVLVRRYAGPGGERLAAGLAIFGAVNVPLIYFSVRIWRTLHPKTSTIPTLDPAMRGVFWLSVLVFTLFFIVLLRTRIDQVRSARRVREAREEALDAGLLA